MTSPDKIRRAITYAVNARKNIADVASINHYLSAGEHITQADLDAHHAAAREIPPVVREHVEAEAEPWLAEQVEVVEQQAFNEHQKRQLALMVETAPPSESLENFEPLHANGAAPSHDGATPDTAEPEIEPLAVLTIGDAKRAVTESQIRLRSAVDRQAQCRQRLGRAIAKWQVANGNVVTDADLRRQHLAHEAEQRELRAAGLIPPRGSGRTLQSRVDQIAAATSGAAYGKGASTFSYRRPLAGVPIGQPGSGPAMSLAQSQATLARMAAMRKLPSER
jgi:hypothetical protein